MNEQAYNERLQRLFRQSPSVQTAGFVAGSYKPGLEGMCALEQATGEPWKQYPCIHVAGTNGKGSVCSLLAAALSGAGLRVGLYTSPHLVDFRERMKLILPGAQATGAGVSPADPPHCVGPLPFREPMSAGGSTSPGMIGKEEVWEFLEKYDAALQGRSFFEVTTAMALWWFARQKVDVAVIETGLGGRLDSTNVIIPQLSIITSIGLDHCALLGDTRAKIAAEKAGIFKTGVPALVAAEDPETGPVFREAARSQGSPLHFADSGPRTLFPEDFTTDLTGPCQKQNLHTVDRALALLREGKGRVASALRRANPGEILDAVARTAARTGLHGRWEHLPGPVETICDIGHNPQALSANFERLEAAHRPLFIVFGIMADKDVDTAIRLLPAGARYYFAAPSTPRALPAGILQNRVRAARPELRTCAFESVAEAIQTALQDARETPEALVYIGGSAFVVAEALVAV